MKRNRYAELDSNAKRFRFIFRSECFAENQYYGRGEPELKNFALQGDFFPDAGPEGGHAGYLKKIDAMGQHYAKTGEFKYCFPDKGHQHLLEAFADSLINNTPSPVEYAGMRATYLSQRAMKAIREGTPLPINIEDWAMYVH